MTIPKRILPLLLILCLCLSLFPASALALDGPTEGEEQAAPGDAPAAPALTPGAPAEAPDAPAVRVTVHFVCEPEAAAVEVCDAQEQPVPAEEDGSFALAVGDYTYSAEAEGYVGVSCVPFSVTEEDGARSEIGAKTFYITYQDGQPVAVAEQVQGGEQA